MKNFDQELAQDLDFTIAGETFTMRFVRPEVLAAWEEEPDDEKSEDILKRQDQRICEFLVTDEMKERWMKLRERSDNAVPLVAVNEILKWMVEVQTSRPTNQPSPLASGRGRTAVSSTGASRSRVETPTK